MSKMTKAIAALGVVAGLGVAALPLSSYADGSTSVNIRANVENTVSVATSTPEVDFGTVVPGSSKIANQNAVLNVSANTDQGWELTIQGKDGKTDMVLVDENDIPVAGEGAAVTIATSDLSGSNYGWGWKLASASGAYNVVPDTATQVTSGKGDQEVDVAFGIRVAAGQTQGNYLGSVVFTATAANAETAGE